MFASPKYDPFVNQVNSGFKILDIKSELTGLAVAVGISTLLTVPTTPVEVPRAYFDSNCGVTMLQFIYDINERIVIDVNATREIVYAFWLDRYTALHRSDHLYSLSHVGMGNAYLDFIRPSMTLFSAEQVTLLQENGRQILNAALVLMNCITTDKASDNSDQPALI